jgi:hypothetical protein
MDSYMELCGEEIDKKTHSLTLVLSDMISTKGL